MKILLTANRVPFIRGGADYHVDGLERALREHGHEVEVLRFLFTFSPEADILRAMDYCAMLDISRPNGVEVDVAISLQFPGYGVQHPNHRVWIMHQHRAVYDLYDAQAATPELAGLREAVQRYDIAVLSRARALYANSRRVAERLRQFNHLDAEPLYHPPHQAERYYAAESWGYVFYPSRLEGLKRQDLLIEAARLLRTPAVILLAGEGGQRQRYQALIEQHGLQHRVRLLGEVTEEEKRALYAHALAVAFPAFDEDYGYVTHEAMLAAKPVITCSDAGGPLEFVRHGENGLICAPSPEAIAQAIDELWSHPARARDMGHAGQQGWHGLGINWQNVAQRLLAP